MEFFIEKLINVKLLLKRNYVNTDFRVFSNFNFYKIFSDEKAYLQPDFLIWSPEPIAKLMESLKAKSKTPHLSIAKRVQNSDIDVLKKYVEENEFEAEWKCNEVIVLRKLMSEKHLGFKESFKIPLSK